MAITRLWFFTLKPTTSPTDPTFLTLWSDILTLCASYTPTPGPSSSQTHFAQLSHCPPSRPHHFLLQTANDDDSSPPTFVFISSYPSLALCVQADTIYSTRYQPHLAPLVQHRALRQIDMEDAEVVPALLYAKKKPQPDENQPTVTVTIANCDPLVSEVAQALTGGGKGGGRSRTPVPPPEEEISGADVYQIPLPPIGEGQEDIFAAQREEEGKRWVRITRGTKPRPGEGDVQAFRLKEVMAR